MIEVLPGGVAYHEYFGYNKNYGNPFRKSVTFIRSKLLNLIFMKHPRRSPEGLIYFNDFVHELNERDRTSSDRYKALPESCKSFYIPEGKVRPVKLITEAGAMLYRIKHGDIEEAIQLVQDRLM